MTVCGILIAILVSRDPIPLWAIAAISAPLTYHLAYLSAVRIVLNEEGVWLQRGLFYWDKEITGVKWGDIDQARFTTGFWFWATNSCDVLVGHCDTNRAELIVQHVASGQQLVAAIAGDHETLVCMGQLTSHIRRNT